MAYRRSYKTRRPRNGGRKLQQDNQLIQRRAGVLANVARYAPYVGALARGVRDGLQLRNQMIAQRNRNVQYRNEKKKTENAKSNITSVPPYRQQQEFQKASKSLNISRIPKSVTLNQLKKITTATRVHRWQNVASVDKVSDANERGALWLGTQFCTDATLTNSQAGGLRSLYCENTATFNTIYGGGLIKCGFHLYCLNGTADLQEHEVGFQPFIFANTGDVTFTPLHQLNNPPDATFTPYWLLERGDQSAGDRHKKYARQNWYDIRLGLRNATAQTTYYDVWVFQFKEAHLDPMEASQAAEPEELNDKRAFYQALMKNSYVNPLLPQPMIKQPMRRVRILKKYRINFQKQESSFTDQTPQVKYLHIFVRDGKMYDYQYASTPVQAVGATSLLDQGWQVQGNVNTVSQTDVPKPKARVWLMVKAYDPRATAGAGGGGEDASLQQSNTPSYDICIRKSETIFTAM